MPDPLIRLIGVTMQFGRQKVLSNVSLDVFPNETLALIGESGCGKSVTLKLIVGLLRPTAGEVWFAGQPLHRLTERQLTDVRRRIGFLFQAAALFDSLTVFENIAFGLRAQRGRTGRASEAEIEKVVQDRLAEVGLTTAASAKMPAELSGGMRKRVGLARARALDPDVMLYDEPTTGLDPIMTDVINELILMTRRRRATTGVVVTHEMRTVHKVAERVVMLYPFPRLHPGEAQVIYDGPADGLEKSLDPRVSQFAKGEARDRLSEMRGEFTLTE